MRAREVECKIGIIGSGDSSSNSNSSSNLLQERAFKGGADVRGGQSAECKREMKRGIRRGVAAHGTGHVTRT